MSLLLIFSVATTRKHTRDETAIYVLYTLVHTHIHVRERTKELKPVIPISVSYPVEQHRSHTSFPLFINVILFSMKDLDPVILIYSIISSRLVFSEISFRISQLLVSSKKLCGQSLPCFSPLEFVAPVWKAIGFFHICLYLILFFHFIFILS